MARPKQRAKGEVYRPVVKVLKAKQGTPTKVSKNVQTLCKQPTILLYYSSVDDWRKNISSTKK